MAYVDYEGLKEYDARRRAEAEKLYQKALLDAHPVKSWYESDDATSPAELFGGSWAQDTSGRVLISAGGDYAVKAEGGEMTHALTVDEMAAHTHQSYIFNATFVSKTSTSGAGASRPYSLSDFQNQGAKEAVSYTGGSQPFNIMQPYRATYRWQRIA